MPWGPTGGEQTKLCYAQAHDCMQGDRVGICVTQLDATLVERGVACTPGALPTFTGAIAAVDKIRFFVGQLPSRMKVHVTVGHQTVMGEIQFFGLPGTVGGQPSEELGSIMTRMATLTSKVMTSPAFTSSSGICAPLCMPHLIALETGQHGRSATPFTLMTLLAFIDFFLVGVEPHFTFGWPFLQPVRSQI